MTDANPQRANAAMAAMLSMGKIDLAAIEAAANAVAVVVSAADHTGRRRSPTSRTVAVPVSDQDRARDFYVGTLGFEVRLDVPMPGGGRWLTVAPPGGVVALALTAGDAGGGRCRHRYPVRRPGRRGRARGARRHVGSTSTRSSTGPACRRCSRSAMPTATRCTSSRRCRERARPHVHRAARAEPGQGWAHLRRDARVGRVLRHAGSGEGARHGRRRAVRELVHGPRRRTAQAAGARRAAHGHRQGRRATP